MDFNATIDPTLTNVGIDIYTLYNKTIACGCTNNIISMLPRGNLTIGSGKYCRFADSTLSDDPLVIDGDLYINLAPFEFLIIYASNGIIFRAASQMILSPTTNAAHITVLSDTYVQGLDNTRIFGIIVAKTSITMTSTSVQGTLISLIGSQTITGSRLITVSQPTCTLLLGCCHLRNDTDILLSTSQCATYLGSIYDGNNTTCLADVDLVSDGWVALIIVGVVLFGIGLIVFFVRRKGYDSMLDK